MHLGILSDTHDQLDRTRRAVELLRAEGAEALAHCGDLTRPEMVAMCAVLPCYFTFGNHDADHIPSCNGRWPRRAPSAWAGAAR